MEQSKVAIIGVYPPPVGGISVHIERLCDALDDRGIAFTLYDNTQGEKNREVVHTGKLETWALKYLFSCKEKVVHVHFLRWQVRFLLSLLRLRGKRVLFTVHNMREEGGPPSGLKRLMVKLTGLLASGFIVVNRDFVEQLASYGINPKKIHYIPPFIPAKTASALSELPEVVRRFLGDDHNRLILSNGAIGNFYQGEDLYGTDLLLSLCEKMAAADPGVRIVYCVTHVVDQDYYAKLKRELADKGLERHFLFLESPREYQTILRKSDLFIRGTNSESFGISVFEALQAGVPVVASNAAKWPPQVVVYKKRDLDDLLEKVTGVLSGDIAVPLEEHPLPDYAGQIVDQYGPRVTQP
ncbi:glycosyltransferase family 4 protein [Brevibacillus sp. B_LB10_24]|uniref:glycosyltransferase family 4 protein n=1 Tax=Brevibacillus sp. B_LB10_24 TaxID=3380645 RepID=UPI0038BB1718